MFLEMKGIPLKYIMSINDMHDRVVTSVRTSRQITSEFLITLGFIKDQH